MKARFRGLRMIALISKGFAWVSLIAGLVLAGLTAGGTYYVPLLLPGAPFSTTNLIGAGLTLLPFLVSFLLLYTAGAVLEVLIAIEANTHSMTRPGETAQLPADKGGPAGSASTQ